SVDFRMATLGKALGLEGAMLATTHNARKYLLHKARPFVFSTAPLPAIAHAGLTAISLAGSMDSERAHVASLSGRVRALLQQKGFSTGSSTTHIIPLLFNSEIEALWYADTLEKRNLHVKAIRPPTVPTPRLRFSMNARVSENVLFQLDEAFA
ncbi:MAG TPA: aminotransferase class I/II-fold pyridoxal phosphate-dependent enzyme, partial [Turneriella sp.]|nr:aminotransferase class I/II-fold pyridoxal phosphate-dependent enzyme [Turneriella sp.]